MRSSILLGVLVSSSVHVSRAALSRRQLPACATNCFLTTTNRGGCNIADTACLCESQVYISSTYACFEAACSTQDLATAVSASIQECAAVGITLSSAVKSATSAALSSLASQTATGASPSRSPSSASATYPAGSSTSSRSSSDSSATNTTAPSHPHPNHIAAIAGGAAGGVVLVLLIGLGICYVNRRRRSEEHTPHTFPTPNKPQFLPGQAAVSGTPPARVGEPDFQPWAQTGVNYAVPPGLASRPPPPRPQGSAGSNYVPPPPWAQNVASPHVAPTTPGSPHAPPARFRDGASSGYGPAPPPAPLARFQDGASSGYAPAPPPAPLARFQDGASSGHASPGHASSGYAPAPAPPTPYRSHPKQPIVMRWEPPTTAPSPPPPSIVSSGSGPGRSRETELEAQVRLLQAQVTSLSPPSYEGH